VLDNSKEQNQRTLRAIILCILVAVIWSQVTQAPKRSQETQTGQQEAQHVKGVSPVNIEPGRQSQVVAAAPVSLPVHPNKVEIEGGQSSFIKTDVATVTISHLGARIVSLKLNDHKVEQGGKVSLDLIDNPDGATFPLGVYAGSESDERVSYTLASVNGAQVAQPAVNLATAPNSSIALEFKGTLPNGNGITKRITFKSDSYLFSVDVSLARKLPEGQNVWLEWTHYFPKADLNPRLKMTHITYLDGADKIHHLPLTDIMEGVRGFGLSKWASLGDIYFMATLIPAINVAGAPVTVALATGSSTMIGREGDVYLDRVAGGSESGRFDVYAGPKDYKTLQFIGDYRLERSIDLGWFSFLALPLLWLLHYLYLFVNNYGLAIIALTLIVKTVMLPLSKASFDSMRKMQEVQPEIKALRERIKDATQLNQETFALYKRRGINPMGGCFPIAIQIPVFLGLYQALLNALELRHAPFALWITDLSAPEKLELFGVGVPVMVLLMAASMIIQQWTTPNPSADPAQQKMMMFMPLIFAGMFIIYPMPAGLVLYWLVNNIISITQQMYMRNTKRGSVYTGTLIASLLIFGAGYILTLI